MKTLQPRPGVLGLHISTLPVFGALKAEHRQELAERAILRLYERGEPLFAQGQRALNLFAVVGGAVRVFKTAPDGRDKVIHFFKAPNLVAEVAVFTGRPFPAGADCVESSTILVIPRSSLLDVFNRDQELALGLLGSAMQRMQELTRSLARHGQKSSVARVASYLLGLAHHHQGDDIVLPGAKKDVACFLGLQPESFSRALATLRESGAIVVERQRILLRDMAALESLLGSG